MCGKKNVRFASKATNTNQNLIRRFVPGARPPAWLPLGDTPMHPEYPCAHCITSAAVAAVLQGVVGNEVGEITLTSPTAPGITRRWTRLQDYSDEVALARIYAGFHYRFSAEVGKEMGKKIGEQVIATQLRRQ